ncbi:hypothetical protein [Gordonia sp. VNK21]|uniref:hypothetical protein n=1 Tax=Gordonia sp. VNK21 TaxID=3382483 RepID=UPI0038D45F5B
MKFDLFSSLEQGIDAQGDLRVPADTLRDYLRTVEVAEACRYWCSWTAESHYSTLEQRRLLGGAAEIPHWPAEICANTDFFSLAIAAASNHPSIDFGSAITNIVAAGGPVIAAERIHLLDALASARALPNTFHIGMAGGRFDYLYRIAGLVPRDQAEERQWNAVKSAIAAEAFEIVVRLMQGDALGSDELTDRFLDEPDTGVRHRVGRRWTFETTRVAQSPATDRIQLYAASHNRELYTELNQYRPVRALNLSITPSAEIDRNQHHLARIYHPDGGAWVREYLPQTVLVFLDTDRDVARRTAETKLARYWSAMLGTVAQSKVDDSASNALVGTPADVAEQIVGRYHPDDRLMLWFDFQYRELGEVHDAVRRFAAEVVPLLPEAYQRGALRGSQ